MADAKKTAEPEATPPKKKGKLMLFIILGVVVVALLGGGAFFMLKKNVAAEDENSGDTASHAAPVKKKVENKEPPVFYKFEKPFTVKLQTEQQEAYLQTEVQLKLLDQHGQELIKQYEPELKHRITLSLMEKKASDLGTAAGVQKLANELRDISNAVIENTAATAEPAANAAPDAPVQAVLFSTFIIQ
jgi:flagellar FliL protein